MPADPATPEDLNYLIVSPELGVLNYRRHPRWRRGAAVGLAIYAFQALRAALRDIRARPDLPSRPTVLSPVASLNQLRAVEPVLAHVEGAAVLPLQGAPGQPTFPGFRAYLGGLAGLPQALTAARAAQGYARLAYERHLDRFVLAHGLVAEAERLLAKVSPRLVLLSNDHWLLNRAVLRAAQRLGLPTAYVQHAAVTHGFPPLEFDVAFLDGLDALEKYDLPGSAGSRAFLTGMAKGDEARRKARHRDGASVLGLALNPLDREDAVVAFANELRSLAPDLKVVYRPHPRDTRDWDRLLPGMDRSDPAAEDPFQFLDRVDAIVCGPSSIALEAALVGVLPLTLDFDGRGEDHYGFIGSGLVRLVGGAAEALEALRAARGTPDEAVLRRYSATVGTHYDGRSAELVAELLTETLAGGVDLSRWQRVEARFVEAYELRPKRR